MIKSQAQKKNIKLNFPRYKLPMYVLAHETKLKQVSNQPSYQRDQI